MKDIQFTLAARCEAAGRDNNEDNYQVISDIASNSCHFTAGDSLTLGEKGTLLVVCDGMGGMNAGEVASAIAVKTVKEAFAAENITKEVLLQPEKYIVKAIQAADAAIKEEGKRNPETEGMGSTIVLAWLLHGKAYIGWCGDSRAYRYNPATGLERLSHDHSYVQELVDAGSITEELAFFHPNNNIITRSLGDLRGVAKPDTKVFDIQQGDLFLLCSDGLCGCLQDFQIKEVIEQHHTNVAECRDALWQADEAAGWHDNVTTVLAQITKGGVAPHKPLSAEDTVAHLQKSNHRLKTLTIALSVLLGIIVLGGAYYFARPCLQKVFPHKAKVETTGNAEGNGSETGPVAEDGNYGEAALDETDANKSSKTGASSENAGKKGQEKKGGAAGSDGKQISDVEAPSENQPLPNVKTVPAQKEELTTGKKQGENKETQGNEKKQSVPETKKVTASTTDAIPAAPAAENTESTQPNDTTKSK